jgi:hypothetical protein
MISRKQTECCKLLPGQLFDLYSFDISSMTWTRLSAAAGSLPLTTRSGHGLTSSGGKLYVHGGQGYNGNACWSRFARGGLLAVAWSRGLAATLAWAFEISKGSLSCLSCTLILTLISSSSSLRELALETMTAFGS